LVGFDIAPPPPPFPCLLLFPSFPVFIALLPTMVYIPFASLLGIQAALDAFMPEAQQPVPDSYSIAPVDFTNPKSGGGSWLDKDAHTHCGEPLNVSLSQSLSHPSSRSLCRNNLKLNENKNRLSFRGSAQKPSSRTKALSTLQTPSDCERNHSPPISPPCTPLTRMLLPTSISMVTQVTKSVLAPTLGHHKRRIWEMVTVG
jgi:hypothetical protein